jgi:hypothetical protein
MALEMGVPFLGRIPIDPQFVLRSDQGKAMIDLDSAGKSIAAIAMIVEKIAH